MCLGMNPDVLAAGERCASTSNRNFEGRQGRGGRTHLVSPQLAAATAIAGHFVDPRELADGVKPFVRVRSPGRRARPPRRRHGSDHPEAVPEADRADRLRRVPLLRLAPGRGRAAAARLRAERPRLRRREDPDRGCQLRLRLVTRARRVGAPGLRLRGRDRAVVRRHLRDQLPQGRPRRDRPPAGRAAAADRLRRRRRRRRGRPRAAADRRSRRARDPVRVRPLPARVPAERARRDRAFARQSREPRGLRGLAPAARGHDGTRRR